MEISVTAAELSRISALAFGPILAWLVVVAVGGLLLAPGSTTTVQAVTMGAGLPAMLAVSGWMLRRRVRAHGQVMDVRIRRQDLLAGAPFRAAPGSFPGGSQSEALCSRKSSNR